MFGTEKLAVRGALTLHGGLPDRAKSREASSGFSDKRLDREWRTMAAMIHIFCEGRHCSDSGLCHECLELLKYAHVRLDRCRFGVEKPTCAKCPVHCYQRVRREQVKAVMRYAGPRMLWRHPLLSLWHWLDSFRQAPRVRV